MRRTTRTRLCAAAVLCGAAVPGLVGGSGACATAARQPARSQWDGVFTAAQADRAAALYDERCNVCHGGAMAPALFGERFNQRLDGLSLNDLFELIRTTMPQDDPGSLTDQQYVDLIAYLLDGGGFPAGSAELLPLASDLKGIVFRVAEGGGPPVARP